MNWSTDTFQVINPEIYQLELTNKCGLSCPNCIRDDPRVRRPVGYMGLDLIKLMHDRGDFDGSYFLELQMYGEPLCAPQFDDIIFYLKENLDVKLGLSTNGLLISEHLEALSNLDFITISIDSPNKEEYEALRVGSSFSKLIANIDMLVGFNLDSIKPSKRPAIDLQVINFGQSRLSNLILLAKINHWNVTCREVVDCFAKYHDRKYPSKNMNQVCLNPWMSVSVQWDGDVVPCCFSAGKDIVYGNLYDMSLKEIWQTSETRKQLVENMRLNYNQENMPCRFCYMRSPVLFHQTMLMNEFRER